MARAEPLCVGKASEVPTAEAGSAKRFAGAAERNRDPIFAVVNEYLTKDHGSLADVAAGSIPVLEAASGTGQHAAFIAGKLACLDWQPSELEEEAFASIEAWTADASNVRKPVKLNLAATEWPVAGPYQAGLVVNVTHIAPWAVTQGLLAGFGRVLALGGRLFVYGPFMVDGAATTPSNARFDAALKERDSSWGLRDVADVAAAADACGLELAERREMPANNFLLVFNKRQRKAD